jgi:phosphomevalonate kinase
LEALLELKSNFFNARKLLREMGERSEQPIEPAQQSAVIDATECVPGVLCSGVPGAGGVDAIFAITLSKKSRDRVERLWSKWHKSSDNEHRPMVCALVLAAEKPDKSGIWLENRFGC